LVISVIVIILTLLAGVIAAKEMYSSLIELFKKLQGLTVEMVFDPQNKFNKKR
jgi:hypothetical protein